MWTDNKVRELATVCLLWRTGRKPQYGLMTLAYHRFTDVLLLIYGSLFLSGVYHSLSVFLPSNSSIVLTRLSRPRSRPTAAQKIWQCRKSNPGTLRL
jgi:hypothetical protein